MFSLGPAFRFLFDQKTWLLCAAVILSQILVASDIENGILLPQVSATRAFFGIILTELLACFIVIPCFLLLFRIVARFAALLGAIRATALTIIVIVTQQLLTQPTSDHTFIALNLALHIAELTFMCAVMLFLVKGKEPFFLRTVKHEPSIQHEPPIPIEALESNAVSAPNKISAGGSETGTCAIQQYLRSWSKKNQKMRVPFYVWAFTVSCIIFSSLGQLYFRTIVQQTDEQHVASEMSEEEANTKRESEVITSESAQSMGNGSKFDFSGCIGKTLSECTESATYAKSSFEGIELHFQVSQEASCGSQERFLLVLGPQGRATSGCWKRNGEEINTWIFTPPDANGKYTKIIGPTIRSVQVMPYYKNHDLPALAPVHTSNAPTSVGFPDTDGFDETDECLGGLKRFVIGFSGNFTNENREAIKKNCSTKRTEWLCFIEKAGAGNISRAEENQIEIACNLNE